MRITGLILALVGLLGGALCVVQLVMPIGPDRDVPPLMDGQAQRLNLMIPLTICCIAFIVGAAMLALGGRSYFVSNNPRVRN